MSGVRGSLGASAPDGPREARPRRPSAARPIDLLCATEDEIDRQVNEFLGVHPASSCTNALICMIHHTQELAHARAELRDAHRREAATAELLKVIGRSSFDLQKVLDTLVESAMQLCESNNATILIRDGNAVVPRAHMGPAFAPLGQRQPLNRHWVTGRAVLDGDTMHVPDLLARTSIPMARRWRLNCVASPLKKGRVELCLPWNACASPTHVRRSPESCRGTALLQGHSRGANDARCGLTRTKPCSANFPRTVRIWQRVERVKSLEVS
jgi:hypothetical protein